MATTQLLACAAATVNWPERTTPWVWFQLEPGDGNQTMELCPGLVPLDALTLRLVGKSGISWPLSALLPSHHANRRLPSLSATGRLNGVMKMLDEPTDQ